MPRQFKVNVQVGQDGIGKLTWQSQRVDVSALQRGISLASDDAILAHDCRRLTAEIPADDRPARIALQRAGFRLEGRMRDAMRRPDGELADVLLYARLASDVVYGAQGFTAVMNSVLPTKRVIAHALFRDAEGRVLLLETVYKDDWELPGGVVEPAETPRDGARREIAEEIGILVELGQPTLVDWMPPYLGWSDAIEFIFDGGTIERVEDLQVGDGEIRAIHWVEPEDVAQHVTELSARRIARILAQDPGYTEAGR